MGPMGGVEIRTGSAVLGFISRADLEAIKNLLKNSQREEIPEKMKLRKTRTKTF
jgi:hypothetical protein